MRERATNKFELNARIYLSKTGKWGKDNAFDFNSAHNLSLFLQPRLELIFKWELKERYFHTLMVPSFY